MLSNASKLAIENINITIVDVEPDQLYDND